MDAIPDNNSRRIGGGSRRAILIGVLLVAGLGLAYAGRRYWREHYAPRFPPKVDVAKLDVEIAEAIETRRKAVLENPRSAEAWGQLGVVFKAHDLEPANACFNEAQRLNPKDYRWPYLIGTGLISKRPDIAMPRLRQAVELSGKEPAPAFRLGEALIDQGQLAEAEKLFQSGLNQGPVNGARARLGLGRIAMERQKNDEAIEHLRQAVADAPGAKSAHTALAQAYHRKGDAANAEKEQAIAARLKQEDTTWPDPALEMVERAWVGIRARMRRIDMFDRRGMREEAVVLARQTAARYPESSTARLVLGEMLNKARNFPAAEMALREALKMDPAHAKTYFELGLALQSQGKVKAAVEAYRASIEKQPDFSPAHHNLALALQTLKDEPGAIEELKAAIRYRPEYVDSRIVLAASLERGGQHTEAVAQADEAARLAPNDPRVKKLVEELKARGASVAAPAPQVQP